MQANLLVNPFSSPFWPSLALLLGMLFGSAAVALALVQLLRQPQAATIPGSGAGVNYAVLWQRYRTWATIGPLFGLAALSGTLVLALLVALLSWQAGNEYARLTKLPANHQRLLIYGSWLACAAVVLFGGAVLAWILVIAFFSWSLLALTEIKEETEVGQRFYPVLAGFWGFLYVGWLPLHILTLPAGWLLLLGLGVALSDIGAFVAGKTIGGPRLSPKLSPNKTIGGALGNLLGAALAVGLCGFALAGVVWWQLALLALTIAVGSIWGDLLESLLKRQRGVKDAGTLLPGFGGLLDRIDSLLLVAPLLYYLSLVIVG